ncbi:MAG: broad specificity phosphatase PhoE [Candidatus Azotimanducaceae bacterium]|jgi:broad specificity phosphatase PhoE
MNVYLIRHGETVFNKKHWHQPAEAPLTERGEKQATSISDVVKNLNPTHVIASPYARAQQTAELATKLIPMKIESNEYFVELKRPAHIVGRHHFAPISVWYLISWFLSKNQFYQDEKRGESRLAFLNRLHDAKEHIESLPQDANVVVFSHSVFISYFVQHICHERPISAWKALLLLLKIKALGNSSVTHLTHDQTRPNGVCKWSLLNFGSDANIIT